MSRFFIPGIHAKPGSALEMGGENAFHAIRVLRLVSGDRLIVCDNAGVDYSCVVKAVGKNALELTVLEREDNAAEPSLQVYLFVSLIKSDKLDYTAQKAVELGCCGIYPFQSRHSVVRAGDGDKAARLAKIAESAAKQSGRGIIPFVSPPLTFKEAVDKAEALKPDIMLAAHEKAGTGLKELLRGRDSIVSAAVFIGPEGGFSDDETVAFEAAGMRLFSLGRRVLRAETAAIAALACCMYELGE
ncbi:MAG: 16S rRNA (uracil(1498)-N(3))-methyltransferase [Defluviitaleaceae bacterium]|nr:16S rRNA (uracil(1498)-N(3))-methyltransferase [Defluviitaleaceae bacterium]MCL2837363.1 16S rRNA (uracil(1498)-N(3))-methyltransferase [Defluviitaleaceae bacterium]